MRLTRRQLAAGTIIAPLASLSTMPTALSRTPDPGRDSDHPYLPDAVFGYATMATNVRVDTIFVEPVTMIFFVYGFATEEDAKAEFPDITDYLTGRASGLDADFEHNEVSIGPLGDERWGYYGVTIEGASDLIAVVRVGPNVLYLRALALAGDTVEYVAEFLDGFLTTASDDPESLIPDISDLPVGWELDEPVWANEVFEIITTPEGGATPIATP